MKRIYSRHQRVQTGFGIIEIMIALALGVIIMLGVTQIATNNSSTRYELDRAGRQMENAAFALREIENDLTNAAFWGEKGAESAGAFPDVCPDDSAGLKQSMGFPVQGWSQDEAVGSNVFDCDNLGEITPTVGTDYLAIRRASSCAVNEADDPDVPDCAPAGTNFHLQVNACAIGASKPGAFEISDDLTSLTYTKRNCSDIAPQYRFLNRIYYINNDQLIRAELVGADYNETVLVDGVEWMSFQFGLDRDGDGQVDPDNGYTSDPTIDPDDPGISIPAAWADVAMVRISLVLHNSRPSSGFEDNKVYEVAEEPYTVPAEFLEHRRQVYSRTVSLRNVAGRRETP